MRTFRLLPTKIAATKASTTVQSFAIFVLFVATVFVAFVGTQTRPDFSGTWKCISRKVWYPLVIQQTHDELIIETRSLPQGPPTETFRLDGERKTTVLEESGYWR